MTVARAGVGFVVATSCADGATESVAFCRESLGVVVTARTSINLMTSICAGGFYSDNVVGMSFKSWNRFNVAITAITRISSNSLIKMGWFSCNT